MFPELPHIEYPREVIWGGPKAEAEYLKDDHMKGLFLGQCLNECRWGSSHDIMYEMDSLEMTEFIKNWMEQNKGDLRFHYKELPRGFELPYIDRKVCPINEKHELRGKGLDGTVRCINEELKEFKEGYFSTFKKFDPDSESVRTTYMKNLPLRGDKEAWKEYKKRQKRLKC